MRRAFLYLLFINILDYLTTAYLIAKQGVETETNPWLVYLVHTTNTCYAILMYKLFMIVVYAISMFIFFKRHPQRFTHPFWRWVVYFFNISYTIIVSMSLYTIYITT